MSSDQLGEGAELATKAANKILDALKLNPNLPTREIVDIIRPVAEAAFIAGGLSMHAILNGFRDG